MIQDIAPHKYHNEYRPVQPERDSILLYFEENKALADWESTELEFPRFRDYPEVERKLSEQIIYLFSIDDQTFYLARRLRTPERGRSEIPDGEYPEFQNGRAAVALFCGNHGTPALSLV